MFLPMQTTSSINLIFLYLSNLMILCLGEDFILLYHVQTILGIVQSSVHCPSLTVSLGLLWPEHETHYSTVPCLELGMKSVQIQPPITSLGMLLGTRRTITLYMLCLVTSNNSQLFEHYYGLRTGR